MSILKRMGLVNDDISAPKKQKIEPVVSTPIITSIPIDDKFSEFFQNVIKENNTKGPDFYEFSEALKATDGQPLPENVKYTVVFAGFAAQGVTKQSLIDSAKFYMGKLDEHSKGFEQSLLGLTSTEVDARQHKIDAIQKRKEEISQIMTKLNEELIKISSDEIAISTEKTTKMHEITAKRNSFNMSVENFKQSIQDKINKITQYVN